MLDEAMSSTEEVSDALADLVRERLDESQRAPVEAFVRQYFAGTAVSDLRESTLMDLYGAALAHWGFGKQRDPGTPKARVYNPQVEQHGWQSTHTIVEIVTDDMPFLVDSVRMALNARGLTTHLVVHPVVRLRRDGAGVIDEVYAPGQAPQDASTEAVMHLEIDRQTESHVLEDVVDALEAVLADVRIAVTDWAAMRSKHAELLAELTSSPPPLEVSELVQGQAFLEWIGDDHFTFLGFREYALDERQGEAVLRTVAGSGLGILRDDGTGAVSQSFAGLPPEMRQLAREPRLLVVTKANTRSTVHRPGYLDYIGVKRFDADGNVVGERRFFGLYTSAAYNRNPRSIPLLREKVARVMSRARYPDNSHAGKALLHILETFPRDLLFQVEEDELYDAAIEILHLQERQRIRLFVFPDRFGRFCSCIVYVPRDRFNTQVRHHIHDILAESLGGSETESEFTVQLSESVLARLYFVLRTTPGKRPDYDVRKLEERLRKVSRSWSDDLADALLEQCGEERGTRLLRRYGDAFRAGYRESYTARIAVHDIEHIEALSDPHGIAMSLYRPLEAADDVLQFKLFRFDDPIPLSDALPMMENMGLKVEDERPSEITRADGQRLWLHDFGMRHREGPHLDLGRIKDKFQDAFARIWGGAVENDGFNRLVLKAELGWREIVILRAYCKYLRQAKVTFSQAYMEQALTSNPGVARSLVKLFHARLDPSAGDDRGDAEAEQVAAIQEALDGVANLDEDRILRSFLGVVLATTRTNYYQADAQGEPKPYVSFKLDPDRVAELPEPRPMYEIFVYSPRVEGVHLRGGPVARGGLRWSDRREDFRTEVLGLMKAQMVKNAVIVPVGSKGGFVPKRMPQGADRETVLAEGVACYRTFIRGLLDITDNLSGGDVVPPADVVRHDGDDPYLVVAADKGTATFSDYANAIAEEYGFWLGDAFASGGSQGYDHKGMGITARGAWESVKRHFRELGTDIQSTDFTVVGIGDMSGDVFGNGMLLSEHIRLVGAFNHLHVFVDPDPDPAASHAERRRLFDLPRSSWEDYDAGLISSGGGVFPRSAKSIAITDEMRAAFGLDASVRSLTPSELMRSMLAAPVDLLWNGGIGTYVKSSREQHDAAGDRANDAIRVDGDELRCKVVGEGGNLGCTQLGRVEAATRGVRINTDAIDNAGGVDCSDHEVNIKVLLNEVVDAGDMTRKQRNTLLAKMTDEVADLVLRNNYLQTQALGVAVSQAPQLLDVHARLIRKLERDGDLDRAIEFLPDGEETAERMQAGRGLTAPELSVLLAYVKITLFKHLVESDLADDAALRDDLVGYFPAPLRERFGKRIPGHRLSREINGTIVANEIVNRAGITSVFRLGEETGADEADIARAYVAARDIFAMPEVWSQIEALDNVVPAQCQTYMLLECRKLVERASRWLLRNRPRPLDIDAAVAHFAAGAASLGAALREMSDAARTDGDAAGGPDSSAAPGLADVEAQAAAGLVASGVPEELATRVAGFTEVYSALDIVDVSSASGAPVPEIAAVYFALGEALDLRWLRDQIVRLPRENRWQALARAALRDDLYAQEADLTRDVLDGTSTADPGGRIDEWMQRNHVAVGRCRQILTDLKAGPAPDFTMLSVAMREIRGMRQLPATGEAPRAAPRRRKKAAR